MCSEFDFIDSMFDSQIVAQRNSTANRNKYLLFFFVLLTVHLSIILVINQLNAQILVL